MADEIVIGKLIVDTSDLTTAMTDSKKAIVELTAEQKKLQKETDGLSTANDEQLKTFVANEAELKRLKAEYAANQKSVLELTKAQTGLDDALAENIRTQNDAIQNTKALTEARRQIDATTVDGAKAIAQINAKIDDNNKFLNANSSNLEQQKNNVGNYTGSIKEAANALNPLNGGLSGFIDRAKDAGGAGNLAKQSLGGVAEGFLMAAKSAIAFILTPVGAVLAALVVVFMAIKTAMDRNQEAAAKVQKIFSALTGVFNVLLKVVTKLGMYFIDEYVKILDKVAEASEKASGLIADSLEFLGFDESAKSVRNFTKEVTNSVKAAQSLADAEKQLEKAQRSSRLTQLNYQKEAEKFRQTRDDETKTIKQRILANDQLGATLKSQLKDELAIAQLALKVANMRIAQEGKTGANLDKQAEALTEIADIQERLTGQESEQLANRNSLQKEAAENAKEATDKANAEAQKRIDVLKAENAQRNLNTEQQIANAEKIFKLENDLAKKSLSGSDEQKKLLENRQNLSSEILAITENQIDKEIEAQKKAFGEKAAADQEEFAQQIESANLLAKAQILLLDEKLLTEKDFAAEVTKINEAKNESIKIANDSFTEAEKVRKEAELANTRALEDVAHQIRLQDISDRSVTENEIRQATLQENYNNELLLLDQSLADKKISYDLYTQQKNLADKKFASETIKNDKIIADAKKAMNRQMLTDGVTALTALFGENKAVAVAAALINTYQGISAGVKLGYPAAIPAVAAAAATGFAAVKNILKTDKGSTSVDSSAAKPVTTSGAGSFVNTAQTETVAQVSEKPTPNNTVVTPPVLILETLLEATNNLAIKVGSG